MLLPENAQTIFIKALGKGNYLNSNFSQFATVPSIGAENSVGDVYVNNNQLDFTTWTTGDIFVVEYENKFDFANNGISNIGYQKANTKENKKTTKIK